MTQSSDSPLFTIGAFESSCDSHQNHSWLFQLDFKKRYLYFRPQATEDNCSQGYGEPYPPFEIGIYYGQSKWDETISRQMLRRQTGEHSYFPF